MILTEKQQAYCPDSVECTPIYSVRQSQSSEVPVGPAQESTNPKPQTRPPMTGMSTSLPSRHRDAASIDSTYGPPGDGTTNMFPQSFQPSGDDMDFSPDLGLGERNPPSDHPTPSTLNSSSNTSYSISGVDNPSPGKKQKPPQGTTSSFERVQPVHISPTKTEAPPMPDLGNLSGQTYPNSTTSSLGATGAPPAFSMPSAWDMPAANPAMSNVDFDNVNVDSMSEAQWAQILSDTGGVAGWTSWRQS